MCNCIESGQERSSEAVGDRWPAGHGRVLTPGSIPIASVFRTAWRRHVRARVLVTGIPRDHGSGSVSCPSSYCHVPQASALPAVVVLASCIV